VSAYLSFFLSFDNAPMLILLLDYIAARMAILIATVTLKRLPRLPPFDNFIKLQIELFQIVFWSISPFVVINSALPNSPELCSGIAIELITKQNEGHYFIGFQGAVQTFSVDLWLVLASQFCC
jgi:hypothetical protein